MKILWFGSQKKSHEDKRNKSGAEEMRLFGVVEESQLDQLISDLKEQNQKPQDAAVETQQRLQKVKEWSKTIDTQEEENDYMARLHHIKLQENFADSVLSGEKSFELRRNDRGYQKGDLIEFEVVNSVGVPVDNHELNSRKYKITYVLSGWGIQEGFVAIAIREVQGSESI